MGLLSYKSNEMYSSTELIRKSKTIFDKILGKKIDKAIILRDGKPSFMLMEFSKYEKIMAEYEKLKNEKESKSKVEKPKVSNEVTSELLIESEDYSTENKEEIQTNEKLDTNLVNEAEDQEENEKEQPAQKIVEAEKDEVVANSNETQNNKMVKELSEEEEINQAFQNIDSMSISHEMKELGKEKARLRIIQARKARAKLLEEQSEESEDDTQLDEHIHKEKLKKEQELEEFWDE